MIESQDQNEKTGGSKKGKSDVVNSKTPVLDNFSRDLIRLAKEGKLDPVIGREHEIERLAQIISRRKKNNPILIGEPGCGKTAIVEGLAMKIFQGDCPQNLMDKRIVSLDMTSIVAGTKYRGQFEERIKVILDELSDNHDVVVFIDEIHTIIGAGNSSGSLDASNIFKPALARGELQCIGATTLDEYREHIEKDGALERRFQKVHVDPTSISDTIKIMNRAKENYEKHHKVHFGDKAIETCVLLADRYITDREFPDKAIDIMDEVGARCQINVTVPEIIEKLKEEANQIKERKVEVVRSQKYEEAAELRDMERKVLARLQEEKEKFDKERLTNKKEVTEEMVYEVVAQMTKIPVAKLSQSEADSLINLEDNLTKSVIGQEDAVSKISKAIRRNRVGIKDPNKPIGSFIFLGSTGIGKTHLAKQLAKEIFGSSDALIRVDMSEYQEKFTMTRLVGSPPGYVGHQEGGQLTEQVKNKPYCVILFDEIEKAHKDVYSLLLQTMDEGHLTDGLGRKINFKNTLIIMTSNIGARKVQDFGTGVGFGTRTKNEKETEIKQMMVEDELKKFFPPEFLNRVDDVVFFNPLKEDEIKQIVTLEISKLISRLKSMNYDIVIAESLVNRICEVGFDEKFGARPIKRAIQNQIEDFISDEILKKNIVTDTVYILECVDDKVQIREKTTVEPVVSEKPKRGRTKKGVN
jgi:ATP-dependent Clp protease ATP-binding subunit ClpC